MLVLRLIFGMLMVGVAYQINDKYSEILLIEGIIIINYGFYQFFKHKSIEFI